MLMVQPKQGLRPKHFDAKDMRRLVSSALRGMPAYEHMSKSTAFVGWKSFVINTDADSWEDSVRGHLAQLDED
jgi:hypothetical protein